MVTVRRIVAIIIMAFKVSIATRIVDCIQSFEHPFAIIAVSIIVD
jgi:hypothetical protein